MLENARYNLGKKYDFYATILQVVAQEVYLVGKRKKTICSIYLPPTDQVTKEDMRDLLKELPGPVLLLGDFNAHNPLWGGKK